jgi:hypothetical protein
VQQRGVEQRRKRQRTQAAGTATEERAARELRGR